MYEKKPRYIMLLTITFTGFCIMLPPTVAAFRVFTLACRANINVLNDYFSIWEKNQNFKGRLTSILSEGRTIYPGVYPIMHPEHDQALGIHRDVIDTHPGSLAAALSAERITLIEGLIKRTLRVRWHQFLSLIALASAFLLYVSYRFAKASRQVEQPGKSFSRHE